MHSDCSGHQSAAQNEEKKHDGGQHIATLPDGDDYCNICFVESLHAAPSIRLKCGHVFHIKCVKTNVEKKWPGARITFGFLNCPLCKEEISHPSPLLASVLDPMLALKRMISQKAVDRLAFEGLLNDEELKKVGGKYFGKPKEYALDRFAYYTCFKCKQPYFGGRRQCEEAAQEAEARLNPQGGGQDLNSEANLVCGGCASGSDSTNCATHGKDYIDWKCKFCCSIASWYCWGTTHFCTDCHKKQEQGDYVTRKPVDQLPKCPGPGKCPLGVKHPPSGQEFSLGCAICRPRDC